MSSRWRVQLEISYDNSKVSAKEVFSCLEEVFLELGMEDTGGSPGDPDFDLDPIRGHICMDTETTLSGQLPDAFHLALRKRMRALGPELKLTTRWKCLDIYEWDYLFEDDGE